MQYPSQKKVNKLSTSSIATLFIATLNIATGFLKVQEDAAAQFSALGFPAYVTETGAPRFAKVGDADILREFLSESRRTVTVESFEAAEWDFDACVPYLGSSTSGGYAPTEVRRRLFSAVSGESTKGLDLDHVCHTDDCDDTDGCAHRMCINPFHLALATRTENIKRSMGNRSQATHCKKGHEYSVVGVVMRGGWRACAACHEIGKDNRAAGIITRTRGTKTHCNKGHEREVYSKSRADGRVYCNRCNTDAVLANYYAKKNSR